MLEGVREASSQSQPHSITRGTWSSRKIGSKNCQSDRCVVILSAGNSTIQKLTMRRPRACHVGHSNSGAVVLAFQALTKLRLGGLGVASSRLSVVYPRCSTSGLPVTRPESWSGPCMLLHLPIYRGLPRIRRRLCSEVARVCVAR